MSIISITLKIKYVSDSFACYLSDYYLLSAASSKVM